MELVWFWVIAVIAVAVGMVWYTGAEHRREMREAKRQEREAIEQLREAQRRVRENSNPDSEP